MSTIYPFAFVPLFSWPAAPGGQLWTYAAGTTTPQTTYSDALGAVPNANPVVLDSTGSAAIRLDPTLPYHFVLKDATDTTTLWDEDQYSDNVAPVLSQSTIGQLLYPQTDAEKDAGIVPTDDWYAPGDVRRYGAVGDGATDDTAGLTNAFKFGLVNFPGSDYSFKISSTLPYAVSGGVVNGNGSTLLVASAFAAVANVSTLISVANANDVTIQGLLVDASAYAGASSQNWGIVFQGNAGGVTLRCRALNNHFLSMPPDGSGVASFVGGSGHQARGNTFTNCHGAVFFQSDHSIEDNNIAYNPSDSSFILHASANIGSSITNNKVYDSSGTPGNHIGIEEGPSDWIVTGNRIFGLTGSGIYLFNSAYLTAVRGGVIADNVIDGGNGVITPASIVQGILTTQYYTHCDIHDNIIKNIPSTVSSTSAAAVLYNNGTKFHDNDIDTTSATGLIAAITINAATSADTLDIVNNKVANTGGGRAYMLAAGAYGSKRILWQGGEIIGGSVGIDANFTVNSGADLQIINLLKNTATTPVNVATNYPVLADFQTFFNSASAFAYPHSMKTLSQTVMYGNAAPAGTSGIQNSWVFNGAPSVGGHLAWVKTGASTWTASAAVF